MAEPKVHPVQKDMSDDSPWPWIRRALIVLCRVAVAAVFIAAALPKILDPAAFADDIANYNVFPYWSWNALAGLVPMLELTGAVALLTGWQRRGAAVLLGGLTVCFIALLISAIARDLNIDCGCFGAQSPGGDASGPIGWRRVIEDIGLLVMIVVAGLRVRRPAPDA